MFAFFEHTHSDLPVDGIILGKKDVEGAQHLPEHMLCHQWGFGALRFRRAENGHNGVKEGRLLHRFGQVCGYPKIMA